MNDYNNLPKTLQQAIKYFSDDLLCINFVASLRWIDGVAVCPRCESDKTSFLSTRKIWKCKACKKQFSVKVGTIFEDSPIGLDKWLMAIWMITNCKNGISSYEIHRAIGVTQKTAWFMLHRIRIAMDNECFDKLSGEVEVDECYIGGAAKNMHKSKRERVVKGRGMKHKAAVMGMLERKGRVKARVIPWADSRTLNENLEANIESGSTVYTDGHGGYRLMDDRFTHEVIDHAVSYVDGHISTNGIENFWSLLKRSIKGTYVSVAPEHLQKYVEEQTYRYNSRKGNDRQRFLGVVGGVSDKRLTYKELIGYETW